MTPQDLIGFVLRERAESEAEAELTGLLSRSALIDRGDAIAGLRPLEHSQGRLLLECAENVSRFRLGDRLRLHSEAGEYTADLVDMRREGCELVLLAKVGPKHLERGPWFAQAVPVDLSGSVIHALDKLQPGSPGWRLLEVLGGAPGDVPEWWMGADAVLNALADDLEAAAGKSLDASQRSVVLRCLRQPAIHGVQGPPGTGKTHVLAIVAEGLARLGKRVLIVAPTHQAVNNGLSAVRKAFPERPVVKVGPPLRRESLDEGVPIVKQLEAVSGRLGEGTIAGMSYLAALHRLVLKTSAFAPHVVIVDEAGQLPLAQGATAGLMGAGSLLLFGDDMQMPPVFTGESASEPLAVSLFGQLRRRRPDAIDMLTTTYRMNAALCATMGRTFYPAPKVATGTRLTPAPSAAGRAFPQGVARIMAGESAEQEGAAFLEAVLDPATPLVWIDTTGTLAAQANEAEAECAARILAACLAAGLSPREMAVVTPYRRQAALVRHRLQARLTPGAELPIIDTVERVQGLTVEIIVVSMGTTDPELLQANASFLLSPNRLNVALSRARTKAVLLAPAAVMEALPDDYRALEAVGVWRSVLGAARCVSMT